MADSNFPSALAHYTNARVTVNYGGTAVGSSDTGTFTYIDANWVEIARDRGERILIPIASIRQIKLLDAPRLKSNSQTLLRPAAIPSNSDTDGSR